MASGDSARQIQDMQTVVHGISAQLNAGSDPQRTAAEIVELIIMMESLLTLNVVDIHSLRLARTLVEMGQPKVALDRLESILRWQVVQQQK